MRIKTILHRNLTNAAIRFQFFGCCKYTLIARIFHNRDACYGFELSCKMKC